MSRKLQSALVSEMAVGLAQHGFSRDGNSFGKPVNNAIFYGCAIIFGGKCFSIIIGARDLIVERVVEKFTVGSSSVDNYFPSVFTDAVTLGYMQPDSECVGNFTKITPSIVSTAVHAVAILGYDFARLHSDVESLLDFALSQERHFFGHLSIRLPTLMILNRRNHDAEEFFLRFSGLGLQKFENLKLAVQQCAGDKFEDQPAR